jgi:hypothetical protein
MEEALDLLAGRTGTVITGQHIEGGAERITLWKHCVSVMPRFARVIVAKRL